jgi:hypothetical protein
MSVIICVNPRYKIVLCEMNNSRASRSGLWSLVIQMVVSYLLNYH